MDSYIPNPIRASSYVLHLTDIAIVDSVSKATNKIDEGTHIYWTDFDSFNDGIDNSNRITVGSSSYIANTIFDNLEDADAICQIKALNNPNLGLDEIAVINCSGLLTIYRYNHDQKTIECQETYNLPTSAQGVYHIIDYLYDTNQNLKLGIVFYCNNSWNFIYAGEQNYSPLAWDNVSTVLDIKITQCGLDQCINFWLLGEKIGAYASPDYITHLHTHKLISYNLNVFTSIITGQTTTSSPAEITFPNKLNYNRFLKKNCAMQRQAFQTNSNDELLILCYLTGEQIDTQVIHCIAITQLKEMVNIKIQDTYTINDDVSFLSIHDQDIHLMHRLDKTLLFIPQCVGTWGETALGVTILEVLPDTLKFNKVSHRKFALLSPSRPNEYVQPLGCATYLRITSNNEAKFKFFGKFHDGNQIYIAHISSTLQYDSSKNEITWPGYEYNFENMPVWVKSGEIFDPLAIYTSPQGAQLGLMALKADITGQSIMFGAPKFSRELAFGQAFGLYQIVPFEKSITEVKPQLTLSFNSSGSVSNNIVTHTSVINSINDSLTISVWGNSLNSHFGSTWNNSIVKHEGSSKSVDLNTTINVSQNDIMHITSNAYNIWAYPVYQKAKSQDIVGEFTIITPLRDNVPSFIPVSEKDFFYDQDYEAGMLLSYVNASKKGYTKEGLLFNLISMPVLGDPSSSSSISYTETNTTLTSDSKTQDISLNAGANLTLGSGLGNVFNINNSLSYNYNQSSGDNSTSSTTVTKGFHINFNLGNVHDDSLQYQITPIVYHQEKTNLLMIKYDVELTGIAWHKHFAQPHPVLFRVLPFSLDPLIHAYTRSIRFTSIKDDTKEATLSLLIFNNSLNPLTDLACKIYTGMPRLDQDNQLSTDNLTLLKEVQDISLPAATSQLFPFSDIKVQPNTYVTIELIHESLLMNNNRIYWGAYPYNAISNINCNELNLSID